MNDWKFSELKYERPDFSAFAEKVQALTRKVQSADCGQTVIDCIVEEDLEEQKLFSMIVIVHIRHTIDTSDEYYEKENEYINNTLPTIQPYGIAFNNAVNSSAYRDAVEEKYGKMYFVQADLTKRSFTEKNIPLMQRESQLTDEYQKIMASCKINFDGKIVTLSEIQKYFENDDREIRKAAFGAFSAFYRENEEHLEKIWDELISIRNEMGRNLGYENYIPLGYLKQGRTDYGQKEVESFREQVREELVPLCEKLYEAQTKRLGIEELKVFDEKRLFPDGNAIPAGDDDFMVAQAQKMYHEISPETGEFIDFMIEHGLMDLKDKPNKAVTGYMTHLPTLKAPFVFSCFNHTIADMQVLTHELGHAFAGYMAMRSQPISSYYSETTDIAEIHSMSMEQFAYPYAEQFFGKDADKFRFAHLQEAITFVPYGVAVDEFQHICYAHPELTPKERTYEWHKLEEKYMPWRKYENDEFMDRGGYWYYKLHIFLYPMYYINYTLTTMGAMEFKKKMAQDHDLAWSDYMELCKVGGSLGYLKTLENSHLANPFKPGSVKNAVSYAKEILLESIEKMK